MKAILSALGFALICSTASAATLDLTGQPLGISNLVPQAVLPEATITALNGSLLLFNGPAADPFFCGLRLDLSGSCLGDVSIDFTSLVENLMFDMLGSHPGDTLAVTVLGATNQTLASLTFTNPDQTIDLSSFGQISGLILSPAGSTGSGTVFRDFTFDVVPTVPVPASLPLLAAGLAGLAALRRRKA